jgi:2-dehydro-3-deoxy-D-arabinonate dehydratase
MIRLYAADEGLVIERDGRIARAEPGFSLDGLFSADDPVAAAQAAFACGSPAKTPEPANLRAPVQSQEVWGAGVTYDRSRVARMSESKDAGGGDFYERVYEADRPELFFKSSAQRISAPGSPLRVRRDSRWTVPEPELTLAVDSSGHIFGYTIGNDMSARDIEGENPLYLPQAKVYRGNVSIGPCVVVSTRLPEATTAIRMEVLRAGACLFSGETTLGRIRRPLDALVNWLFREDSFPYGCYLMTGTGIVPPDTLALRSGDEVRITIEPIGTLVNPIEG